MDSKSYQCSLANLNDPTAPPKTFTFDGCYYTDSTTESIYNEIAYPLVEVRLGWLILDNFVYSKIVLSCLSGMEIAVCFTFVPMGSNIILVKASLY